MADTVIVSFSGFTENIDDNTGTMQLYNTILHKYQTNKVDVLVPREWNDKPKELAKMLKNIGYTKVILIGYSWGGGWGSRVFAYECKKLGLKIPLYLLCDPVFRPLWMPGWMGANPLSVRSMLPIAKISIPDSVEEVHWVRQYENKPAGHDLIADNPEKTKINAAKVLKYKHTNIDNCKEWFELVNYRIAYKLDYNLPK